MPTKNPIATFYHKCYSLTMAPRTAVIISCTQGDAAFTRERARSRRQTISGYILDVVMRLIVIDDRLFATYARLAPSTWRHPAPAPGPKTTLLIRCSQEEANRIRLAAKRRDSTVSAFVRHALHLSWKATLNHPPVPPAHPQTPGRLR
jgi:hypothetical protein